MKNEGIKNRISRETGGTIRFLAGCLALVAGLSFAQIRASRPMLVIVMGAFLAFLIPGVKRKLSLPILLFFLPWSPLMKMRPGSISFFTVGLIAVCVLHFISGGAELSLRDYILTAVIAALTLIAKMLQGNQIAVYYVKFIFMLLLFPAVAKGAYGTVSFRDMTVFFAMGIISAALTAKQVSGFTNISAYIKVDSYLTITRLSGFYGDPNFYSAHITACMAAIQLLLPIEQSRMGRAFMAAAFVLLTYCGLLSASKAFAVIVIALFIFWIPVLLERRNRSGALVRIVVTIIGVFIVALSLTSVRELLRVFDDRFRYAYNISRLTTHRTDLWQVYFEKLAEDPVLALFGEGYTTVNINGRASHNSLIQSVYQFGLLGLPAVIIWLHGLIVSTFADNTLTRPRIKETMLMIVGAIMPWMSLDILFFDEFFLLPVFVSIGLADSAASKGQYADLRPLNWGSGSFDVRKKRISAE